MDEASRIDERNQQVGKLKEALADAHIDQTMLESYFKGACQRLDVDPQQFKKNTTSSNNDECQEPRYISMTEEDHCAEKAQGERLNGILKEGYLLDQVFRSTEQAREAARQAINLYHVDRPHLSHEYNMPDQVHRAVQVINNL